MAKKKKSKKKVAKKRKKSRKKRTAMAPGKIVDLGTLLDQLSDAQRELNRMKQRLTNVKTLCRRIRVYKLEK